MHTCLRHTIARAAAIGGLLLLTGCWQNDTGPLDGEEAPLPPDFRFLGRTAACYLEVGSPPRSIRVNCFHIDGVLHIHSNRFAKVPRLRGESWVDTVRRQPDVRVAIEGAIYPLRATPVTPEQRRVEILHERGYTYAWDGITIFSFHPRLEAST